MGYQFERSRIAVLGAVAGALLGCGGSAESEPGLKFVDVNPEVTTWEGKPATIDARGVIDMPPLPTSAEAAGQRPYVVASVDEPDFHLDIVRILVPLEGGDASSAPVTTFLMRQWRTIGSIDRVGELQAGADALMGTPTPLTMDEIYTGLTGNVAPNELLTHHGVQANRLGRTTEFLTPTPVALPSGLYGFDAALAGVDKAVDAATDAAILPAHAGHHYSEKHLVTVPFCDPFGISQCNVDPNRVVGGYACTPPGSGASGILVGNGVPGANSCTKTAGWIHLGFYNPDTVNQHFTAQEFYGPIVGNPWTAFPAFDVPPFGLYNEDWDDPSHKAIAGVFSRTLDGLRIVRISTGIVVSG